MTAHDQSVLRVYTHPACRSCREVLVAANELAAERDDLTVELSSLASEAGLERAQARGILVVPAVEFGDTVVESALTKEELAALVDGEGA
ncbi:MAG TPA: hypothetical protein VKA37_10125 [Halobacteriales archaeon]|nr:hypothetical protein [Halobacteriales archaeon]